MKGDEIENQYSESIVLLLVHLFHPSVLKSPAYSVAKHVQLTKKTDTLTDWRRIMECSAELPTDKKQLQKQVIQTDATEREIVSSP